MQAIHIELLQGMPISGALREDMSRLLLERTHQVCVAANARFFRKDDPAKPMFVLHPGRGDDQGFACARSWRAFCTSRSTMAKVSSAEPVKALDVRYLPSTTRLGTPLNW